MKVARCLGLSPVALAMGLVASFVVGACGSSQPPHAASSPSPDQVLVAYRSAVDLGWDVLHRHGDTWSNHCGTGPGGVDDTRGNPVQCRADSVQLKADAQRLVDLLAAVAVKPELQDLDRGLKQALGELPPDIDRLIVAIDTTNVGAQHDMKLRISKLWNDAWFAVDGIDCWPKGVQHNGLEAQTAHSCVST